MSHLPCRLGFLSLLCLCCLVQSAPAQEPEPLREGTAQRLQTPPRPQSGQLQPAQAFERVGKQLYPQQPTGRTTLQRTNASPWLERFLRRRKRQPEAASQADEQPTTQQRQPTSQQRQPRSEQRQRAQVSVPTPPNTSPTTLRPNRSLYEGPAPLTDSGFQGTYGSSRPPSRSSSRQEYRIRTQAEAPSIPSDVRSDRVARVPVDVPAPSTEPAYDPSPKTAPSVTRIPLPESSMKFQEHAAQARQPSAQSSSRSRSATRVQAPEQPEAQPTVTTIPAQDVPTQTTASGNLNRPKTLEVRQPSVPSTAPQTAPAVTTNLTAQVEGQTPSSPTPPTASVTPRQSGVPVPTQLTSAPMIEKAAEKEARTPPRKQTPTTQLYGLANPLQEQGSTAPDTNATGPLPLPPAATTPPPSVTTLPPSTTTAGPSAPSLPPAAFAPSTETATLSPEPTPPSATPESTTAPTKSTASTASDAPSSTVGSTTNDSTSSTPSSASMVANLPLPQTPSRQAESPTTATPSVAKEPATVSVPAPTLTQTPSIPSSAANGSMQLPQLPATQPNQQKNTSSANTPSSLAAQPVERPAGRLVEDVPRNGVERLRMRNAGLHVLLDGPTNVAIGAVNPYTIRVINSDEIDLNGLLLRMEVPAGVRVTPKKPSHGELDIEQAPDGSLMMTWGLEQLRAGKTAQVPLNVVAQADKDFSIAMEWTLVPLAQSAPVHVMAPQLEVAMQGPNDVIAGEKNTYRLLVSNAGESTAKNVVVSLGAKEFGSTSSKIGDVPPGSERDVEIEMEFQERGQLEVLAVAAGQGNLTTDTRMNIRVRQPHLVAEIIAPKMVYHGSATTYTVRVRNEGDAPATGVTGRLVLPQGSRPNELAYSAQFANGQLTWPIQALKAGAESEFKFQINLAQEGENSINLAFDDQLSNTAEARVVTLVRSIADLKLVVIDPVAPAPVGSEVVYDLKLTNRGSKAAHDVKVVAQFSEGIEPTRGEGHGYRVVPGQVYFEPIDTVRAGETIVLRVFAKADGQGMHRFRTEVRADSGIRLTQEESTEYLEAASKIATQQSTLNLSPNVR